MAKAIEILSSDEAKKTLDSSATTFLQESAVSKSIRVIARKYHSLSLARITADLRTGGHFDKVIVAIDKMIGLLRIEEAEDIEHRDRCQGSQNKNKNDKEDIAHDIEKRKRELSRLGDTEKELKDKVKSLEDEIKSQEDEMKDLLDMRNKDNAEFTQALQDDMDAVDLISKAIVVMSEFYKRNKIDLALVQKRAPEYSEDPDKPPETSWSGGGYGGRKSESSGIIAILTMIKEDTIIEMKDARADEAEAQKEYLEQKGAMTSSLEAMEATKASTEGELSDVQGKIEDIEEAKKASEDDMEGEKKMEDSLNQDCAWVDTHFDKRREARKVEMDGLVEAKNYLAGVEAGDEV